MNASIALNAELIDSQYQRWKSDPDSVSREWRFFFEGFDFAGAVERLPEQAPAPAEGAVDKDRIILQSRVEDLIYRYRDLGHLLACLDPLSSCPTDHPLLSLAAFHLTPEDLDRTFSTHHLLSGREATLREILQALRATYCHAVGVEFMHLQDPSERRWLQNRMEPVHNEPTLTREEKLRALEKLHRAAMFENFLHTRYVGQKRFSLEGAEGVIAMLDALVMHAGKMGAREVILGMAHRGRLNVEANILGKPYEAMFHEFEGAYDPECLIGAGDVKYHKGYMADVDAEGGGKVRVLLVANPSHLESVDPVVEGVARSRQEQLGDHDRKMVLPVLIHGDAAFAGQGVVFETLNLSQLEGYSAGGTVHIVINNQIGFTTLPEDARSTRYATDAAKALMAPIFHVHGENPEALIHIVKLACDYRAEFQKDVVIDVVCYRRYGHNEGDEPYYTQPQMYERIKDRPPVNRIYSEQLVEEGVATTESVGEMTRAIQMRLDSALEAARRGDACAFVEAPFYEVWKDRYGQYSHDLAETAVPGAQLLGLAKRLNETPPGFSAHPRLKRILDKRLETVEKGEGIDWATGEMLAFATILEDGAPIRLSGQDSRRGTFSQRHSVLVDIHTGEHYTPLANLGDGQAPFHVFDSMLSEYAVLGFEYGYAMVQPLGLNIWEAQFGDFVNNAQTIVDEYIAGAETKWLRKNGLTLLLPHGYEGQGADHSSARIERFLSLCAEENLIVCYPTTPAQFFHLLRRQVKAPYRKPLVVFSPKSLLRNPLAASKLSDFASGGFQTVLPDETDGRDPKRAVFCSGKVYYELMEKRAALGAEDVAIARVEQFHPFPEERLREVASGWKNVSSWIWAQEEPENMGGWTFMRPRLEALLGVQVQYVGRPAAASPATGFSQVHKEQQAAIAEKAIRG